MVTNLRYFTVYCFNLNKKSTVNARLMYPCYIWILYNIFMNIPYEHALAIPYEQSNGVY